MQVAPGNKLAVLAVGVSAVVLIPLILPDTDSSEVLNLVFADGRKTVRTMDFVGKTINLTLEVNKCDNPVSVTATMDVPDLRINWSHTYTSDDIVAVPGFTTSLPSILSAGVYLQVAITPKGDELRFTVKLLAGGTIMEKSVYPVKTTVTKGDLSVNTNACGFFGWWYDMSNVGRGAMIVGCLVFILIMIVCCRSN